MGTLGQYTGSGDVRSNAQDTMRRTQADVDKANAYKQAQIDAVRQLQSQYNTGGLNQYIKGYDPSILPEDLNYDNIYNSRIKRT